MELSSMEDLASPQSSLNLHSNIFENGVQTPSWSSYRLCESDPFRDQTIVYFGRGLLVATSIRGTPADLGMRIQPCQHSFNQSEASNNGKDIPRKRPILATSRNVGKVGPAK